MSQTTYHFSIQNDFPNHKVAPDRLTEQLAPSKTGIVPALLSITTTGDDCAITYMDALSPTEEATLDNVVATHSGEPLPNGNFDADGNPVVAPTFLFVSERARLAGNLWTATAGQVAIFDVEVTTQLLVQGGQFWVKGAAEGDYADFSVVDKNDVLGLFATYGLTVGVDVIELAKYVDHYPVPDQAFWKDEIIMPTVAPVKTGLFLRCVYHSQGVADVKMGLLYRWYEGT
jgi:hypothetical protein